MIEDIWDMFVYLFLVIAVALWTVALFGCAGPEAPRPIDRYRTLYFFSQ